MPRFAHNLFAALAAVMIMAGSFGAIVNVPPASAHTALSAPQLA